MNQFDFEENISEEGEVEFQPVYNRHFIELDENNNIVRGFSDAFVQPTSDSILLTDKGSLHFRLFADGEQNPNLFTMDGIPLYKWDGEQVVARTEAEIEADREAIPTPPAMPTYEERLAAMESAMLTMAMALGDDEYV